GAAGLSFTSPEIERGGAPRTAGVLRGPRGAKCAPTRALRELVSPLPCDRERGGSRRSVAAFFLSPRCRASGRACGATCQSRPLQAGFRPPSLPAASSHCRQPPVVGSDGS